MTSEKELRRVAAQLLRNTLRDGPFGVDYRKITPYKQYDLDDKDRIRELHRTWPIPDLPEPDNAYPEWQIENLSISPGIDPGEVAIVWEGREDTGRGTMPRSRYLSPDQVQAIIAAHYHREDQE